ncbi:cell growth-regulating nucleolar protein [Anopheles darlingi]|uniref:cell growth-regulating nucleolar protein n=1 Tax=Anopheles darlingi TaxID=43151 RepID=UPI0021004D54|nr:cell growth-regulating nucleolar protein [Anopheles darlingi]
MVFFICNHCGESLKKQAVEKHGWRCKRELNVSCMDCLKDFPGKEYEAHTSCISEAEKYSGKDYVPKANANKGARKQETWISTIRSITDAKRNLPKGIMSVFEVIQRNDNIPRKMKGFMNFFQNSAKHIRKPDVEAAWALIEEEVNRNKQQQQQVTVEPAKPVEETKPATNGTAVKRKQEPEVDQPAKKKQKKNKSTNGQANGHDDQSALLGNGSTNGQHEDEHEEEETTNGSGKFRWNEVIRDVLLSKDNQMKLSKLKKKVLKRYQQFTGDSTDGKFEKKFGKKISKAHFVVENDTVRLIA